MNITINLKSFLVTTLTQENSKEMHDIPREVQEREMVSWNQMPQQTPHAEGSRNVVPTARHYSKMISAG